MKRLIDTTDHTFCTECEAIDSGVDNGDVSGCTECYGIDCIEYRDKDDEPAETYWAEEGAK